MSFKEKIIQQTNKQELILTNIKKLGKASIIYGAGIYAYVLYQFLTRRGIQVSAFVVDKEYKSVQEYMGVKVLSLDEIPKINSHNVFIGVADYPSIEEKLRKNGIHSFFTIDVPDFLNIPNQFMDFNFIISNEIQFQETYDIFEDELSRETYIAAINSKINNELEFLKPVVRRDHLYFAKSELVISDDEVLLDVGGYIGDSIRDFCEVTKGSFRRIISLEPFPKLYDQLTNTIAELGLYDRCQAVRIGAWHENGQLSFSRTEMEIDSKIEMYGTSKIDVDRIDTIVKDLGCKVTFVKMDINGSEFNALSGAKEVISTHRPTLAIKMHVKEDFYRLPLLLKSISPDIKLYLRQRNFMSMMLVLYGVHIN